MSKLFALKRLLLTIVVLSVSFLAVLEAALRLSEYPNFDTRFFIKNSLTVFIKDPLSGVAIPNREQDVQKPPNTYRIAFLGGSFTEALPLPVEKTFSWMMTEHLAKCSSLKGKKIDPVLFGVTDFGTAQDLLTLRHRVWRYQPDLVVLTSSPGNDIRNISRKLELERVRPFYSVKDGELQIDDEFIAEGDFKKNTTLSAVDDLMLQIKSRLHIFRLWELVIARFEGEPQKPASHAGNTPGQDPDSAYGDLEPGGPQVFRHPLTPEWQEAWTITEILMKAVYDDTADHGVDYFLALLPSDLRIHPDLQVQQQALENLDIADVHYLERRLQRLGMTYGFDVLPLSYGFNKHVDRLHTKLSDFGRPMRDGHLNENGHALAAEMLADFHCARLARIPGSQSSGPRHSDPAVQPQPQPQPVVSPDAPRLWLPQQINLAEGLNQFVFYKKLLALRTPPDVRFVPKGTALDFAEVKPHGLLFKPSKQNIGRHLLRITIHDQEGKVILAGTTHVVVSETQTVESAESDQKIRILTIGENSLDSLWPAYLADYLAAPGHPRFVFVGGTKYQFDSSLFLENKPPLDELAYEGGAHFGFFDQLAYYTPDTLVTRGPSHQSPLVFTDDTSRAHVDISQYIKETLGGAFPDFILLNIGENSLPIPRRTTFSHYSNHEAEFVNRLDEFLDDLKAAAPDAAAAILLPPSQTHNRFIEIASQFAKTRPDISLIATNLAVDPITDYQTGESALLEEANAQRFAASVYAWIMSELGNRSRPKPVSEIADLPSLETKLPNETFSRITPFVSLLNREKTLLKEYTPSSQGVLPTIEPGRYDHISLEIFYAKETQSSEVAICTNRNPEPPKNTDPCLALYSWSPEQQYIQSGKPYVDIFQGSPRVPGTNVYVNFASSLSESADAILERSNMLALRVFGHEYRHQYAVVSSQTDHIADGLFQAEFAPIEEVPANTWIAARGLELVINGVREGFTFSRNFDPIELEPNHTSFVGTSHPHNLVLRMREGGDRVLTVQGADSMNVELRKPSGELIVNAYSYNAVERTLNVSQSLPNRNANGTPTRFHRNLAFAGELPRQRMTIQLSESPFVLLRPDQPKGYKSTFVIVDHADYTEVESDKLLTYGNSEGLLVPENGFAGFNIPYTKSIFPTGKDYPFVAQNDIPYIQGSYEDNRDVRALVNRYRSERLPFELSVHAGIYFANATEAQIALKTAKKFDGNAVWTDHGSSRSMIMLDGWNPEMPKRAMLPYLADEGVRYAWANTDRYHLTRPDDWKGDGLPSGNVYSVPELRRLTSEISLAEMSVPAMFGSILMISGPEISAIEQVIRDRSVLLSHTYLGLSEIETKLTDNGQKTISLKKRFSDLLRAIDKFRRNGDLYVSTLSEWADYYLAAKNVRIRRSSGGWHLDNSGPLISDFALAAVPLPGEILRDIPARLDGVSGSVHTRIVDGVRYLWFDLETGSHRLH